jgi:two-component system sensor kinase FixL
MKRDDVTRPDARRFALRIGLIYTLIGGLWILFSDLVVSLFTKEPAIITRIEIFKGWAFIGVTALILSLLIHRGVLALGKSEQAFRESEERFRLLIENTASAIFIYRDRILLANRTMETLTGYTREELLAMSLSELVLPGFREELRNHCEAFHKGGAVPLRCEFAVVRKDGEERWIDFTSSIIKLDGGDAGLGTAFDVTERRKAEEELRESEERFRLLIEGVTDYEIFMLDLEGRIVSWNIGAERNKGYRAEEVIGQHHSIFFIPEDVRKGIPEQELLAAAMTDRYEDEGWRVRKDGSTFWANVVVTSLRGGDGRLRGYSKVIRDITERKIAEDKLRESEERYRVIAESASDAILTIDEESTILFASSAVEKIFGYEPDQLVGRPLDLLMPGRFSAEHTAAMKRYLETGSRTISWKARELPGLHRDGREIPLDISFGEFFKGGRHFFSGIVRDITERKQAEKEKEYRDMLERFTQELETLAAERTMSLMAMRLADSVRNPAAVIGWTGRKLMREDLSGEVKNEIGDIIHEAERLEVLVKDFQTLLKSRRSAFTFEDVNEIVKAVIPIFAREAAGKKVALVANLSERPLKANVQKDLLRMAIFNLLRNAFEATPEGGTITVITTGDADSVYLSVSDTGAGIPAEIIDNIFDPFFTTKVYRFGMGLPMIKQIVSEHLGRIEVESREGAGTTFRLVLPVRWSGRTEPVAQRQE